MDVPKAMAGALVSAPLLFCAACEQRMNDQPRLDPLQSAGSFPHDQAALYPPENTVPAAPAVAPLEELRPERYSADLLRRGRERYEIFCVPCHGVAGYGNGPGVLHGFPAPPSFHQERLRNEAEAWFVEVITEGYGVMYSYADRVPPADRWAIAAWIRALQLSQHAPLSDFPEIASRVDSANP